MAMGSLDMTTVTLIPDQLKMRQRPNMIRYRNIDWSLGKATFDDGKEGITMTIVMKRKITSEMMTTFFPSLLLTFATFFKPFFFVAAFSVNLTTMLVMTTILISNLESLPYILAPQDDFGMQKKLGKQT